MLHVLPAYLSIPLKDPVKLVIIPPPFYTLENKVWQIESSAQGHPFSQKQSWESKLMPSLCGQPQHTR